MNFYQNKTKTQLQGLEEMPVVTEELEEMSDEEIEEVCGGADADVDFNLILLTAN